MPGHPSSSVKIPPEEKLGGDSWHDKTGYHEVNSIYEKISTCYKLLWF